MSAVVYPGREETRAADKPLRILIVDDEESILLSLCQNLTLADDSYAVGTAESAEDALSILENTEVDVLVTDLRLPAMDGLELAKKAREMSPRTRAILMTAYGNDNVLRKAQSEGCIAYLEKPFSVETLLNYISESAISDETVAADLHDISLLDIMELYAGRYADFLISATVAEGGKSGHIVVRSGSVVHAEFGGEIGADALAALLYMPQRKLIVSTQSITAETRITRQNTLMLGIPELKSIRKAPSPIEVLRLCRRYAPRKARPQIDSWNQDESISCIREALRADPGTTPKEKPSESEKPVDDFDPNDLVLAPEPEEPPASRFSFNDSGGDDLTLHPEVSPSVEAIVENIQEIEEKVKALVTAGIENFKNQCLEDAKNCWELALQLDPTCKEAKTNLAVLRSLLKTKTC